MSARTHLEVGSGHFLARISLGVSMARNPMLPFEPKRIATSIGDHPIAGIFDPHIRSRLLKDLSKEGAAVDWSHVTVVRLGYPGQGPSECPATILVAVMPNTLNSDGAAEILRSVAEWIYSFPELHDVAIEMIESAAVPYHGNVSNDPDHPIMGLNGKVPQLGYSFEDAFRNVPALGVSLGIQDSNSAGTLGGYLVIRTAERSHYMALTCHHVLSRVFSHSNPKATFANPERWPS